MKRLNVHIRSVQRAFEERPEVFQAIRMDMALRVANSVVDDSAVIVTLKIVIRHKCVGTDRRTLLDMVADVATKLRPARVRNHVQDNAGMLARCCPLQNTLYRGFPKPCVPDSSAFV